MEYFTAIMSSPVQNKRVIKKKNSHVDRISQLILGLPKNRTIRFWWRIRHALSHSTRSGRSHYGESQPWLTPPEFTDIVAISQMTPGPIGINSATYVGYVAAGNSIWGSIIATFAVCLPSFILVLLVSRFILKHKDNITIKSIFSGLRPVVVSNLICSGTLCENTPHTRYRIGWYFRICLILNMKYEL